MQSGVRHKTSSDVNAIHSRNRSPLGVAEGHARFHAPCARRLPGNQYARWTGAPAPKPGVRLAAECLLANRVQARTCFDQVC